jgi:hypothetical protein
VTDSAGTIAIYGYGGGPGNNDGVSGGVPGNGGGGEMASLGGGGASPLINTNDFHPVAIIETVGGYGGGSYFGTGALPNGSGPPAAASPIGSGGAGGSNYYPGGAGAAGAVIISW